MGKGLSKIILIGYVLSSLLFFFFGSQVGENKQKQIHAEAIQQSQEKNRKLEADHRKAIKKKEKALEKHKQKAIDDLSDIAVEYDGLLQLAKSQAGYYKRLSEAGEDGCGELAGITTAYSENLVRGTNVVGRLKAVTESLNRSTSTLVETLDLSTELLDDSE